MTIQNATERYDQAVAELEQACFSDPWPVDFIARRRDKMLLALEGETLLGYVSLSSVLDEGSLDSIAVSPAFRRRGVADALMAAVTERGRARGIAFITLEVRAGNAGAIALYEKHGYVPVGRRTNYYERPREDAVLMTLIL